MRTIFTITVLLVVFNLTAQTWNQTQDSNRNATFERVSTTSDLLFGGDVVTVEVQRRGKVVTQIINGTVTTTTYPTRKVAKFTFKGLVNGYSL